MISRSTTMTFVIVAVPLKTGSVCSTVHGTGAHTLQELINGATLNSGDIEISNWQLDQFTSPGIDLSLIDISAITSDPTNPGIQYVNDGELSTGVRRFRSRRSSRQLVLVTKDGYS